MALRGDGALLVVLLLGILVLSRQVTSAPQKPDLLFPFGFPFGDQILVNETDDYNSVEVPLKTAVVFYEQTYSSIFVSTLFVVLRNLLAASSVSKVSRNFAQPYK